MDYTIYILAQGKSSRMGSDKGLIPLNRKEMILYCIENLRALNREIIIITSNLEYEKFGHRLLSDKVKFQGPARGILTALEDSETEKSLIVSCDMPLVNYAFINSFLQQVQGSQIVCFEKEYLYPFPAFYSKNILSQWKQEIEDNNLKLQRLIPLFNYKTLPIENLDLFLNVNTLEDLKKAEQKLM